MALDGVRNRAYYDALREVIQPGSVVLDVGAGVGIMGLMAARLGARRVYLVDPEDILEVAREVVRDNGLTGVVECLRARIEDVRLPERADVIVSVLTGNFLVTEDLLETLFFARDVGQGRDDGLFARVDDVAADAPVQGLNGRKKRMIRSHDDRAR